MLLATQTAAVTTARSVTGEARGLTCSILDRPVAPITALIQERSVPLSAFCVARGKYSVQERCGARRSRNSAQVRVAASVRVAGAFCASRWSPWCEKQQLQRLAALNEPPVVPAAAETVPRSVLCHQECSVGNCSSCSVQERCRSVLWCQKQPLQRLGALQEPSVASKLCFVIYLLARRFCVHSSKA